MKKSVKRILAGLLSLCMAVSAWTPALSVEAALTQTNVVNVATNATATSKQQALEGTDIAYVNDGSEETSWQTSQWPSKVELNLNGGKNRVSKIVVKLGAGGSTGASVKVKVEYAQNGITKDLIQFGTEQTVALTGNMTGEFNVAIPVSATHVYVTLSDPTGGNFNGSIKEIEIYNEETVTLSNYNNIASQALITTDGATGSPNGVMNLTDNNTATVYGFHNGRLTGEKYVLLTYAQARKMDAVKIAFESKGSSDSSNYTFTYSILAGNGGDTYDTIVDHFTANRTDKTTQTYSFEEKEYSEIRIVMHKCGSTYSKDIVDGVGCGWPSIAEFEVYGSEADVTDDKNIALKRPVHTSSGAATAQNITDGSTNSTWNGGDYPSYVDIDLQQNYNLEAVEVYTPSDGYSQYSIYTSLDGRNFKKLAEKTTKDVASLTTGERYEVTDEREARIVRVYMEYNSASTSAVLNEVRVLGTPSGTAVQELPEIAVKDFEDSEYADTLTVTAQDTYEEVYGIIERRLGEEYKAWFTLELAEGENDYDYYELSMKEGKVLVKGNNGVSLATGINHYLKYYCNVHISQVGDQTGTMPATAPAITGTVHKETKAKVRYSYNYCTLSYSMAFWGENEWRDELDWLALNGVNVVLDATAQEEVWRRFLSKLGYKHEDIKDFIAGPAYYAWAYMDNLSGFGGPVHDSWFEERTELARKNQQIMRNLGMQPVLQGYSGMVPVDINDYISNDITIIDTGMWCGFQRPAMIKTTSDEFDEYAALFYQCQKEVYGDVTNYYATDPFHEASSVDKKGMTDRDISREVLKSMLAADEDAIWIIQAWQGNPTTALLNGLDDVENGAQHALVLDLYAEKTPHNQETGGSYGDTPEFDKTPWIFCMLNNFGGRLGLHGHLDNLANNIPAAFNRSEYIAGIGITPEASVNNPVLYDFLFETVWQDDASEPMEVIKLDEWLVDYTTRRYGEESTSAQAAWAILKETVYKSSLNNLGQGAPESVVNARPALNISAASTWGNAVISYDKVQLEEAAELLLAAYDELKDSEGYMYDVANVLQQVLSNSAQEYQKKMTAAYNARNLEEFKKNSDIFLEIIDYMESVTATSEYFLLGRWVEQAKALGKNADDFTKELYEFNAKALITTWGSYNQAEGGRLKDYSNRQWSGLIGDFYKPRWERWITARTKELKGEQHETSINWFQWEWEWVRSNTAYTTTPTAVDLEDLGTEILAKYSLKDPKAARDISTGKMTVYAENYQPDNNTEGDPNYVLDGSANTIWHTRHEDTARDTHYLIFTFDEVYSVDSMRFLQRPSGNNGVVTKYSLYYKENEADENWKPIIVSGTLTDSRDWQQIFFEDENGNPLTVNAKQIKLQVEEAISGDTRKFAAAAEIRFTEPQLWPSKEGETEELSNVELKSEGTSIVQINGVTADDITIDVEKPAVATVEKDVEPAVMLLSADTETIAEEPEKIAKLLVTANPLPTGVTEAETLVTVTSTSLNQSTSFTVTVKEDVEKVTLNVGQRYPVAGKVSGTPTNSNIVRFSEKVENLSELDVAGEYMIVPARAEYKALATDFASNGYVVDPTAEANANRKFYWKITKTESGYALQPAEDLTKYVVVNGNALTDTPTYLKIEKHTTENYLGFAIGVNNLQSWNLSDGASGTTIGRYHLDGGNIWYLHKKDSTTITGLTPGVTEVTIGGRKYEFTVVAQEQKITLRAGESLEIPGTIDAAPNDVRIAEAYTKIESIDQVDKAGGGEYMIVPARAPFKAIMPNAAGTGLEVLDIETNQASRTIYWKITKTNAGYAMQPSNDLNKYVTAAGNAITDQETSIPITANHTAGGYTGFLLGGSNNNVSWNLNGGALGTAIAEHHKNDGGNIWYLYQKNTTVKGVTPGTTEAMIGGVKYKITVLDNTKEITLVEGQSTVLDGVVESVPTVAGVAGYSYTEKVNSISNLETGKEYMIASVLDGKVIETGFVSGNTQLKVVNDINSVSNHNTLFWKFTKMENGTYKISTGEAENEKFMNFDTSATGDACNLLLGEAQELTITIDSANGYNNRFRVQSGNYNLNRFGGKTALVAKGYKKFDAASLWDLYQKKTTVTGMEVGETKVTIGGIKYTIKVIEDDTKIQLKVGETMTLPGTLEGTAADRRVVNASMYLQDLSELENGGEYMIVPVKKTNKALANSYPSGVTDYLQLQEMANVTDLNSLYWKITNSDTDNEKYYVQSLNDNTYMKPGSGKLELSSNDKPGITLEKKAYEGYVGFVIKLDRFGINMHSGSDTIKGWNGADSSSLWQLKTKDKTIVRGMTPGVTTVTIGGVEYQITVIEEKDVTVKAGETVKLLGSGGTIDNKELAKIDTSIANVATGNTTVNKEQISTYDNGDLSHYLYTFEKVDSENDTYRIYGVTDEGERAYINIHEYNVGYPNSLIKDEIKVTATGKKLIKKIYSPAEEKEIAVEYEQFVFTDTDENTEYALQFICDWHVFNENPTTARNEEIRSFELWEAQADTTGASYSYKPVEEIQDGGKYVIVVTCAEGIRYVLRPYVKIASSTDRNQMVAGLGTATSAEAATEVQFTGVSAGNTSVLVGTTKYNVHVLGEKDITIKVGETIQIFDWSGIYDESGRAELNENIAGVDVTDSKVINEEKANLFDKDSSNNDDGIDRYKGNPINVSACLYKFELIDGNRYYISGTTASGETVYLNPNEGSVYGYPNRADKEAVEVESGTTADGSIGFKFKDSEEKDPNGNDYYLQFVNDWCLFNEYPLETNGNLHDDFVTVVFKLYELVEDQTTGVYNYQLVTKVQNGGQYAIVADYDYNKDGTNDTEFLLRPSSNIDTADTKSRNDHAAKIATDIGDASNTVLTTRNEVRMTGVSKGRTEITVGNTTYNIFVIQEEHEIELMEGKTIVLSGTTLKVGPNTEFATIKKLQEGGYLITAVKPGTTDVEIDNVLYHITVLKKEIGSEIGTSNGHKVTRLKMTADKNFDLNVINTELTKVKWSVTNLDGTPADWATIDQNGVVSATPEGKQITTGKDGYIVAEVYDDNGNLVERIEIEFRLNPQPADLNNVRLYDIYIDDLHHTDLYYGWIYADASQEDGYANSPKLIPAIEGEVFYISMDSKTGNALDFFAKPENGYALTQMNATGTLDHYKKLEGATASDTEFMQPGIAGANQAVFARNEVLALVDMARALGCHGAHGFTNSNNPTVLTYRSEQLPTVKKAVIGAWDSKTGYQEYTKDMKVKIGDYVFFSVTVDTYACEDLITYSNVEVTELLEGATFISEAPNDTIDPTAFEPLTTIGITEDVDGDKLIANSHTYYAMYQIKLEDVANALHTVKNTVSLSYDYQSEYSTSAFAGTANGAAAVIIENIPLKSIVVDFGLPVEYTFETGEEYQPLTNVKTLYGEVSVTSTPDPEKPGIFDNTVTYTPTTMLQGADFIKFTPVDADNETKVVMIYPATTVYYEEGFATYTGTWGGNASKGTGNQAHRYLETMDNLDQYGYDAKYAKEKPGPSNVTQAISSKSGNTASFEFTGTGTDIYANCSPDTGNVTIFVRAINPDGSAGAIKKLMMINTKMEVGKSELTQGQSVAAYNMLLASVSGLEHGTYSVEIIHGTTMVEQNKLDANNNPIIDPETGNPVKEKVPKSKTISLDGFRVYNTLENSGIFNVHYEDYPNFVEMRNVVLNSIVPETLLNKDDANTETSIYAEDIANKLTQVLDPNEKAGAMILSTGNSSYTDEEVKDLLDNGPKNELFLYEGQALTFTLAAGLQNVQIGMKAVNSGAKVTLVNGENSKSWNMTTSTDMFYTIGHMDADTTIVIQNVSDEDAETNNILSITDLKYFVPQTMPIDVFAPMTADAFATALLSMGYEAKPTPEVTEEVTPEATPEVTEEVTPEATPEVTEEVTPETTPEVTEEVTPETTPEVTEEVTPETTPEVTEEVTPEATPEVTEEVTPEATPEVTEEVTVEVNKSKLESLVNGAITDGSKFTEESWKVFAEALEVARAVVEKEDATQEEVDAAYKALFSAAFKLVNKPVVPEVTPEETPVVTPEETPVVTPEETPGVTPEVTPGVTPEEVCKVFEDVKHEAWYEVGVQYVYDSGLMNGSDGKFNPTADITRAQLVTTLYRHAGSPEVTDTKALTDFSDVVEEKYYTDAVCWAYAEGIATGNDGKFDPNGQLTRQQMAAFFYRYAKCQGEDVTVKADISEMVGADKVSGYAKEAVEWAVGAGLISGSETTDANGNVIKDLNPRGNTTRAQVAMILQRFCEN